MFYTRYLSSYIYMCGLLFDKLIIWIDNINDTYNDHLLWLSKKAIYMDVNN